MSEHGEAAAVDARVVLLLAHADVDAVVAREGPPEERFELLGVPRDVDRPAGQRRDERDVLGRLVRAAGARRVVGGAGRDEHGAEVVVAEVELEELPGPLDEERRVGVRDRPVALEREAGGDADHQLLADADVEVARMVADRVGADLGGDDGDALVLVERLAGELVEAFAHGRHLGCHLRDDAARPLRVGIGRRARLERVVVASVDAQRDPALELKRRSMPSGQPCAAESLSIDDRGERRRARRGPAYCTASQFEPSSSSPSPTRHQTRRPVRARADGDPEAVSERAARDLDARHELAVGVVAERRVERAEAVERVDGTIPFAASTA